MKVQVVWTCALVVLLGVLVIGGIAWLVEAQPRAAEKPMQKWTFNHEPYTVSKFATRPVEQTVARTFEIVEAKLPRPKLLPVDVVFRLRINEFEDDGSLMLVFAKLNDDKTRGRIAVVREHCTLETVAIALVEIKALQLGKPFARARSFALGRYIVTEDGDPRLTRLNPYKDGDAYLKKDIQADLEWFAAAYAREVGGLTPEQILNGQGDLWLPYTEDRRIAPGFQMKYQLLLDARRRRK